nr:epithelial cell-transforming sequence 2 oncogene-like isoform X3 [Pogona vitticeps]
MTTVYTAHTPYSIKQWHLESLGILGGYPVTSSQNQTMDVFHTRFSTWTPFENKTLNNQLFQERIRLIGHWFDLWMDKQRKQFLQWILSKCNKSQLKFAQMWLLETIPMTEVDFTTLLPRFISLYIFSFLNPKDLCAAAQVNWHWKFLTEQDSLWMPKAIKLGWFLPYTSEKNEYGVWKQHYIACATNPDYFAPKKTAETHRTNQSKAEHEEKMHEKCLRKTLRETWALHKKELFKARPPWISGTRHSGFHRYKFQPNLPQTVHVQARWPATTLLIKNRSPSQKDTPSKYFSEEVKFEPKAKVPVEAEKQVMLSSFKYLPKRSCQNISQTCLNGVPSLQPHLILISSHVPAYEMILDSVKPEAISVVYEPSGATLESLLYYVQKALDGQTAKSIGILSDGDSRGLTLIQGYRISSKNLLKPEVKGFWEKLRCCVEEGGHIDIFVSLAASEAGMEVLSQLSHLTGVLFRTPTGIATGSYHHLLSEWLGNQKDNYPPFLYFTEAKLLVWLRFTELLEDALKAARRNLRPYFCDLQKHVAGRIIGQIMFDTLSWSEVQNHQGIAQALADGLTELSRGNQENPLEFLSHFLMKKSIKKEEFRNQVVSTASTREACVGVSVQSGKRYEDTSDKRKSLARELLLSEGNYVHTLEIVRDVYVKPLNAALASNRAILNSLNVQLIFTDILCILQLNRWFLGELTERLKEWSPAQNIGEVFITFGHQLQTYTNFFNNYAVILKTIDKCRETIPVFRAFLRRHDRTVITSMRSLQDLLLCPSKRIEEYLNLLYALKLHTPAEHTDREDVTAAIKQMEQYRDYVDQHLLKANRYLIRTQKVVQLNCCSERVSMPYRLYEHTHDLTLFLFNDILVISLCSISYKPFERIPKTTHHFLAAVKLHQLLVEDIPDSKYIKNAFFLQGPKCHWICSTEEDDKFPWLSALERAINCSLQEDIYSP